MNDNGKPAAEKKLFGKKAYEKKVNGTPIKKKSKKNCNKKKENETPMKKKKMTEEKSNEESGIEDGSSATLQIVIERKGDGKNEISRETPWENKNMIKKRVDGKNEIESKTPKKNKKEDGYNGKKSEKPKKRKKIVKEKGDEKIGNECGPPKKKKKGNKNENEDEKPKKEKKIIEKKCDEKPKKKKKITEEDDDEVIENKRVTPKKKKMVEDEGDDKNEKPKKKKITEKNVDEKKQNGSEAPKKKKRKKKVTKKELVGSCVSPDPSVQEENRGKKHKKNDRKNTKGGKMPCKNIKEQVDLGRTMSTKIELKEKDESDSGVDEMDTEEMQPKLAKGCKPCLKLGSGFVWDVPGKEDKGEGTSSEDDYEEEEQESKKRKRKKLSRAEQALLAKEEERRLFELESSRLEKERLPQSALDYEELLQESPNSSAIWIQFVSFHLENAEVDQAKAVAQRALQKISVEEFEERINVWTVILRLEVLYGTEESVTAAFSEAVATNDPLKIHSSMAMVYAESSKIKEAEEIYFKMTKKFSQVLDVWIKAGIFFFKNYKLEEARKYMDRALLSLHKNDHVNLINRFAQLEFQFGELERGRTMFESLLSNYPKRMDMWIVYVDLLTKRGDIEGARLVLERMTSLNVRLRQMRSIFKKFLEFEKLHGTPQNVEIIKRRVQEYVAAKLKNE